MSNSTAARSRDAVTHGRVIRLALPMTLANLSTPLLGFADATVIGRLGDAALLGAVAAAAIVFDFLFWGFSFLRLGTAGLTAQATGAGDSAEQRATFLRAILLAVLCGSVMVLLQQPIAALAFRLLDAAPEVTAAARSYFDIRIWSAPFALVNYVVLGTVIGRGRTDLGLLLQVLINLGNVALNVALVAGLHLGIRGSALGTLIAEGVGCATGLVVLWRLLGRFTIDWRRVRDRAALLRLLGISRDIMIRSAALLFVYAFFTAQGARGGAVVLAANAVLINLFMIASYFLDGFATAAEQICGQALGARDEAAFRRAVRLAIIWCLGFATVVSILAFAGGTLFIETVSTSAPVREAAHSFLPYAALAPLLGALAFAYDGVFIGATWTRDMRNLMLCALLVYFALFFALRPLGNVGLWIALSGFLGSRGLLQHWRYPGRAAEAFGAIRRGDSHAPAHRTLTR